MEEPSEFLVSQLADLVMSTADGRQRAERKAVIDYIRMSADQADEDDSANVWLHCVATEIEQGAHRGLSELEFIKQELRALLPRD